MKIAIISYSYTGNNDALATWVGEKLSLDHFRVSENKKRKTRTIAFDMLFGRIPAVLPEGAVLDSYDLILFFGPVWMGQPATPLRSFFRYIKGKNGPSKYGFISLSGGSDHSNPLLAGDLEKRTGRPPYFLLDLHIADLLASDQTITRQMTSDLVKLRRTSGTLKNGNWLRTDTGADSRESNEAFGGCRTRKCIRQLTFA